MKRSARGEISYYILLSTFYSFINVSLIYNCCGKETFSGEEGRKLYLAGWMEEGGEGGGLINCSFSLGKMPGISPLNEILMCVDSPVFFWFINFFFFYG